MKARKRPTLRDIASRVGVSETAASFALNGRPGISDEVRQRVLDTAAELNYRPSYAARLLTGAASQSIGLVLPSTATSVDSELFFMRLLMGMQTVLAKSGYGLLVQIAPDVEGELAVYQRWHEDHRVDGVVLVNLREDDPRPAMLQEWGLSAVLAGGPDPSGRIPSVSIDDDAAMRVVLDHVRAAGHTNVAYVCGDLGLLHIQRRVSAFEAARRELFGAGSVVSTEYTSQAAAGATKKLLSAEQAPSAIICDNEVLAVAVSVTAASMGLKVGEDLAVLSCEDSPVCEAMHPPITALHRDTHGFGADIAAQLLEILAGRGPASVQEKVPELLVRASSSRD